MTREEINSNLASVSQEVKAVLAKLKTAMGEADKAERIAAAFPAPKRNTTC